MNLDSLQYGEGEMLWLESLMCDGQNTYNNLKTKAISFVLDQLRMRGEDAILSNGIGNDIYIRNKDIKIKVKFSKPIERKTSRKYYWEFNKVIYRTRLWPNDIADYYILVGYDQYGEIRKMWSIPVDDKIIYRKNQIYIDMNNCNLYEEYSLEIEKYDLRFTNGEEFKWIEL